MNLPCQTSPYLKDKVTSDILVSSDSSELPAFIKRQIRNVRGGGQCLGFEKLRFPVKINLRGKGFRNPFLITQFNPSHRIKTQVWHNKHKLAFLKAFEKTTKNISGRRFHVLIGHEADY